jgi:hypothetical protein
VRGGSDGREQRCGREYEGLRWGGARGQGDSGGLGGLEV